MAVKNSVAFVGLGVMGYPMAGHLAKAGLDVCVYNRTTAKADRWVAQYGARSATTPAAAASGADIVFQCVGNDEDDVVARWRTLQDKRPAGLRRGRRGACVKPPT